MYNVGDKILYPMHGAGVIEAIEEKTIQQERRSYYVLHMPMGNMKVLIPIHNSEEIGIRSIIDRSFAARVYDTLAQPVEYKEVNWNKRYRENMQRIRSGDILQVAIVVKSLVYRDRSKGLSAGERKMLTTAKHILFSELILAGCCLREDCVENYLNEVLEVSAVH